MFVYLPALRSLPRRAVRSCCPRPDCRIVTTSPPRTYGLISSGPSSTRTICPYKGEASYWSLNVGGERLDDVAWSYPEPLENALKASDHFCFSHDGIALHVDGSRIE